MRKESFRLKKNRDLAREKVLTGLSDSLMADPEKNIKTSIWDSEKELLEKADIHLSRLRKYGCSRMNGNMLYLGPKGGVYRYTSQGKKRYV